MAGIKTPFSDAVVKEIPRTGAHSITREPNLPDGCPGRDGGLLPEKIREEIPGAKKPSFADLTSPTFIHK